MGVFDGIANIGMGIASMNHSEHMQQKNFAFQREMFNATNKYNSPKETAARLLEGGYNPGFQGDSPFSPATSPAGGVGSPGAPVGANFGNLGMQFAQAYSALQSSEADANLKNAQAEDLRNRMPFSKASAEAQAGLDRLNLADKRADYTAKTIGEYYKENANRPRVENQKAVSEALRNKAAAALDDWRRTTGEPGKLYSIFRGLDLTEQLNSAIASSAYGQGAHFNALAEGQKIANKRSQLDFDTFKQFYDTEHQIRDANGKTVTMTGKAILQQEPAIRNGLLQSALEQSKWLSEHPVMARSLGSFLGNVGALLFKGLGEYPK